jgi:hypothetical protein
MMLLWACAGVPLGAYNIAGHFNVALQVQPQILTVLSLITWIQCYYYDDVSVNVFLSAHEPRVRQKWSVGKCCVVTGIIGAFFGGIESALVFALKVSHFSRSKEPKLNQVGRSEGR